MDYREYKAMIEDEDNSLEHFGILGMHWGVRKNQTSQPRISLPILSKKGEVVELHQNAEPITAQFLAKLIPSIKKSQEDYTDYDIKSKDGKKIGSFTTNRDNATTLNLVWMGIQQKERGNGYAQSTMRTIIDNSKKTGIKQLTLEVPTTSPDARHIYEKIGFVTTGEKMLGSEDDFWGGLTKMKLDL